MQTLAVPRYRELAGMAEERGVTVQQLIRAVVVPEWQESTKSAVQKRKGVKRPRRR